MALTIVRLPSPTQINSLLTQSSASTIYATKVYADSIGVSSSAAAVNYLTASAPAALNTLDELASALGDDSNFATTIINLISEKLTSIPGMISPYAASTIPTGWLRCDGSVYNISSYPALGNLLSSTYGGNGTTTFGVPDLRGRTIAGMDIDNGGFANRLTNTGTNNSGINGSVLGASGGDQRVQLHQHLNTVTITDTLHSHGGSLVDGNQPPGSRTYRFYGSTYNAVGSHTHSATYQETSGGANDYNNADGVNFGVDTQTGNQGTQYITTIAGQGGHDHPTYVDLNDEYSGVTASIGNVDYGTGTAQNVQPTMILTYIIKT